MARARNIKPSFFKNPELVECSLEARLLFIGLWTLADREGYLEDRPKRIKMELFPGDDVDVNRCLDELDEHGLIDRYTVGESRFLHVCKFLKHQHPHHLEKPSTIPRSQTGLKVNLDKSQTNLRQNLDKTQANPSDSLNPDSLNPESLRNESDLSTTVGVVDNSSPSLEAQACIEIRKAGIERVNPSHAKMIALCKAGATPDEFRDAAIEAKGRGKASFAYVLATVEGRRRDASELGNLTTKPRNHTRANVHDDRKRAYAELTGQSKPEPALVAAQRQAIEGAANRLD
ncbi:MAG: hypothetical protein ING75_17025 [Rhodocyclaceae bacterium]|nr:hypothetical protein [Rhodocyclaceae bacterium]